MKKPVAIQLYSVRTDAEKNLYGTLKALKRMGYDGVEFAGLYGHTATEVKDMLCDIGLVPLSAHIAYYELITDTDKIISDYSTIGVKYIGIPWLAESHLPGGELYSETLKNIKRISLDLKQKGIGLLYHNHDFEFKKLEGKYLLDIIYTDLTPDEIQTEIDLCWVAVSGENPAEYLTKYAGRAPVVHFKDYYKEGNSSGKLYSLIGNDDEKSTDKPSMEFRPLGVGMQNLHSLIKAADKAGCGWIIVEQDEPTESMSLSRMECAQISISNLFNAMI